MVKYERQCLICGKEFTTKYERQHICSFDCRQENGRRYARRCMRKKRHIGNNKSKDKVCIICGFNLTTDLHHEGKYKIRLCPNHHALITRGIKTIEDLIKERDVNKLV